MTGARFAAFWLLVMGSLNAPAPARAAPTDLNSWFQMRTQELFDAIAVGDRRIWDQTLDEVCTITTEDGEVMDKPKFLAELHPLPKGFVGRGTIRNLTVRNLGSAAVVHYRIDETETIFAQELRTSYLETDTYRRDGEDWKMVAMQVTVVPRDLEAISGGPVDWPALEGEYRFPGDDQVRYQVFQRDGALFGGRTRASATELIPLAPLTFFQKGSIHFIIFVKDATGRISGVREIHKYNEVGMLRRGAQAP